MRKQLRILLSQCVAEQGLMRCNGGGQPVNDIRNFVLPGGPDAIGTEVLGILHHMTILDPGEREEIQVRLNEAAISRRI